MCPCGWRMIDHPRRHFTHYWKCIWDVCTWEAFAQDGGKVKYWYD